MMAEAWLVGGQQAVSQKLAIAERVGSTCELGGLRDPLMRGVKPLPRFKRRLCHACNAPQRHISG